MDGEIFKLPTTLLVGGIELMDKEGDTPGPNADAAAADLGDDEPVTAAAIPCGTGMVLMDHGICGATWKDVQGIRNN